MDNYSNSTILKLKTMLTYCPDSGDLRWAQSPNPRAPVGAKAGVVRDGYLKVGLDKKRIPAHRIAWLLHYGEFPTNFIDHQDGNPLNNRIENLRDVPNRENCMNQSKRSDNTSNTVGVSWHKRLGKWMAYIAINRKRKHLGYYDCFELACFVRKEAEETYGYHPNHGRG